MSAPSVTTHESQCHVRKQYTGRAGWRKRLFFDGVCDFPKGLVGADGTIKAVTSDQ
jgi:hypothetical protein